MIKDIGQRIGKTRQYLQISQRDLASSVGVTPQHISAIEQNKRSISLNLLVNLANELGTTTDYILTGKQGLSDVTAAIKADQYLNIKVKKAFAVILAELRQNHNASD